MGNFSSCVIGSERVDVGIHFLGESSSVSFGGCAPSAVCEWTVAAWRSTAPAAAELAGFVDSTEEGPAGAADVKGEMSTEVAAAADSGAGVAHDGTNSFTDPAAAAAAISRSDFFGFAVVTLGAGSVSAIVAGGAGACAHCKHAKRLASTNHRTEQTQAM
jgi:hypothetical protein